MHSPLQPSTAADGNGRELQSLRQSLLSAQQGAVELGVLLDAARDVLSQSDMVGAARAMLRASRSLTGAQATYLALCDGDTPQTDIAFIDNGQVAQQASPAATRSARLLLEYVAAGGRPLVSGSAEPLGWSLALPEGHITLQTALVVPLTLGGSIVGVLGLASKPGGFQQDDVRIAQALADLGAVALTHARSVEQLEASEEQFRSLTATAQEAILALSDTGEIVLWNRGAARMFGFEDASGLQVSQILPDLVPDIVSGSVRDGLGTSVLESQGRRRGGERFPAELTRAAWQTHRGSFTTLVIRDVSERKRSEQALLRYGQEQQALYAISSAVASDMDAGELITLVLDVVLPLFDAKAGWVVLERQAGDALVLAARYGISDEFATALASPQAGSCQLMAPPPAGVDVSHDLLPAAVCQPIGPRLLAESGLRSHVGVSLHVGDRTLGALHMAWRHERPFEDADTALALAMGHQVGLALNNARLHQASLQVDRLRQLVELDAELAATVDPAKVQETALRHLARGLGARLGMLFVVTAQDAATHLEVFTLGRGWLKMEATPAARVFIERALAETANHRRPIPVTRAEISSICPIAHESVAIRWGDVGLLVPIWSEQGTVALVVLGGLSPDRRVSSEDLAACQAAAARAGQAIEVAWLVDALRKQREAVIALTSRLAATEENERRRLASELHDEVGQNLTALGLNLNIASMLLAGGDPLKLETRLADSQTLVSQTTDSIRNVMADLRPPGLDEYGLLAALRWYGRRCAQRYGIAVDVVGTEPCPRLSPSREIALFRITQEALTNVAKHARATRAQVSFAAEGDAAILEVIDDGIGFDQSMAIDRDSDHGWGLLTMAERATAEHGHATVASQPGRGTIVRVQVPLC